MSASRPVYTIGHSTRTLEEFVALLREHGVEVVVDVRRFPASRRHPHFNGSALARSLAAEGIGYRHEVDLGGRRSSDAGASSVNDAWTHPAFRAYADHTATPAFQAALVRLMELAGERTPALMCAEAVPWRCHRRLISDALLARGVPVLDITGPGAATPATLSPHARVRADGTLIYPATPARQEDLFAAG